MQRSHKIKLQPNNKQATYFAKACGISRFTYNWGLAEWQRQYEAGEKPSAYGLKKQFNSIKKQEYPWIKEITKCSPERAFDDLDCAFKNFFRRVKQGKKSGYPKFKKKGLRDSFYISAQHFRVESHHIRIPKLGWVRMRESMRFKGKIQSVVISKNAAGWFAAILVDIPDVDVHESQVYDAVGVDLGVNKLATLSDGVIFDNPKNTQKFAKRLRRLNKSLARKKKGSNNWKEAKKRLGKLHYQIACNRQDSTHKLTSYLVDNYSDICLEDLNVAGMVKNRHLAKAVSDAAFCEIKRQLDYKAIRTHYVDRFFPSTKLCMECGQVHDMPLNKRVFKCDCNGIEVDRDYHAANNILRQGLPNFKPVETEALALGNRSETVVCEAGNVRKTQWA